MLQFESDTLRTNGSASLASEVIRQYSTVAAISDIEGAGSPVRRPAGRAGRLRRPANPEKSGASLHVEEGKSLHGGAPVFEGVRTSGASCRVPDPAFARFSASVNRNVSQQRPGLFYQEYEKASQ